MNFAAQRIGQALARYLAKPQHLHSTSIPAEFSALAACLQPADVLLVEGHSKISAAMKYLTQSTWSHAALYVGDVLGSRNDAGEALCLIEADMLQGAWAAAHADAGQWRPVAGYLSDADRRGVSGGVLPGPADHRAPLHAGPAVPPVRR